MPAKSLELMWKSVLVMAARPKLTDRSSLHQLQGHCRISFQPMVTQLMIKISLQRINISRGSWGKYKLKNSCNMEEDFSPPFSTLS